MSSTLRNVLILVAIAAAVTFLPGGGDAAEAVGETLRVGFLLVIFMILMRVYREGRTTILGFDERFRALLYVGVAAVVFAAAGTGAMFGTAAGSLLWVALVAGAVAAFVVVWRHWRTLA